MIGGESMHSVRTDFPDELLTARADELLSILGKPTLFHLPGRRSEPLFVSVLLHGNEDVGWRAVQQTLRTFAGKELPRALSVFVGNVAAAQVGQRRLDDQPDFNRVWPGTDDEGSPEHAMMRRICEEMAQRKVFVSVDLHNNTGRNPLYCCVNRTDPSTIHLARLFSPTVVLFDRPHGVQSKAFSWICPSITCECGKVGDAAGLAQAVELLEACLHLSHLPDEPVPRGDVHLFRTVATISVPAGTSFDFDEGEDVSLHLVHDLENWNFKECSAGMRWGRCRENSPGRLMIHDLNDRDVTTDYFAFDRGVIILQRPVIPAMLTLERRIIAQDCLGYFMERVSTETVEGAM